MLTIARLQDIDSSLYKKLYSLNRRADGTMRDYLVKLRHFKRLESANARVYCVTDNGELQGWALVFERIFGRRGNKKHLTHEAQIYVRAAVRRNGVGTRLMKRIYEDFPKDTLFVWRVDAPGFFKSLEEL